MNMRKKILFSAGALAVALAPAVGFGLPEAAGAEVSPVAFSVSAPERGVVRGETSNPEFIYDDGDYLDANQEARLRNIAKAVWQTSGHRIIYISTTDPAMEDDPEAWLDDYAKTHNISLDSVILLTGDVNYTTADGQTSDAISDADWEQLLKKYKSAENTYSKRADSFFMTFADYLNKHPLERAGSPAAASQPAKPTPPTEQETPAASNEPADSANLTQTELGDIIEFPDEGQVPYVGGQPDAKSAAPFIRDHSGVFSKSNIAGWEKQMTALAEKYGIAPYIVTVDDFDYQTPEQWGANYYNANQLGLGEKDANGVLMVINPTSRDLWFMGHGDGEKAFTVYGIEKLYYHVKEPLGDDDWDGGVDVYLAQVADYLEQWKAGTPYSESHPLPHPMTLESTAAGAAGAAALGGGAGTLVMRRIRKKHDTAQLQSGATYYVVPGSDQITGSNDVFVNEYTTQVARPKSSDSSDFSGGSFSSGGTSFSSGGGKF
ncbi:TPM domain-containing protein [uncultured Mobiluncus sp.]|uniref:TPM domain-containing protein n=1 Tax=uncultured Mobiluncus sp. TaxID=293425 RepID=UPI00288B13F6|nr:TPM domain-containing protein [uncultured Mobiluncus sp.]